MFVKSPLSGTCVTNRTGFVVATAKSTAKSTFIGASNMRFSTLTERDGDYTDASAMNNPSMLGRYRLLDRIGAGAMGEVYRAQDSVLDRPVALKIISGGDEERRRRFRREAQSAARSRIRTSSS